MFGVAFCTFGGSFVDFVGGFVGVFEGGGGSRGFGGGGRWRLNVGMCQIYSIWRRDSDSLPSLICGTTVVDNVLHSVFLSRPIEVGFKTMSINPDLKSRLASLYHLISLALHAQNVKTWSPCKA